MTTTAQTNEEVVLDHAASAAKSALRTLFNAEGKTLKGWTDYGKALAEGRNLFASNEEFGKWIKSNKLDQIGKRGDKVIKTNPHERSAAIWSAQNPDQFEKMQGQYPAVTTTRGLHAKWKAHANTVATNYELADIEDTDELVAEMTKVAEQTGLSMDELAEAVDKQKARDAKAAAAEEEAERKREAEREMLRAEIETEVELSQPAPQVNTSALVNTMRTILIFATVDAINAVFAQTEAPKLKTAGDPSHPFWTAKLAKSKAEFEQRVSDLNGVVSGDPLGDDIAQSIRALALDGALLPGEMNPPTDFDLGDTFAATVMGAVRNAQEALAA